MWDFLKRPLDIILWLFAASQERRTLYCPAALSGIFEFSLDTDQWVTLQQTTAQLCTMIKLVEDGSIPVARSYETHGWERSGSRLAASLPEIDCSVITCQAWLPSGTYVIQNRPTSAPVSDPKVAAARFLEAASFGATPKDLEGWNDTSPEVYVKEQMEMKGTYHREFYRTRMNPIWRFHKPEFAASLDPCDPSRSSTWRRNILNAKDRSKKFEIKSVDGRRQVLVNDHVRTMVLQLRYNEDARSVPDGTYTVCSTIPELRKAEYRLKRNGKCLRVVSEDLIVDFPSDFVPAVSLPAGRIPALSDSFNWTKTSDILPEYALSAPISHDSCANLPELDHRTSPLFAKTSSGEWMIHDPRAIVRQNMLAKPIPDGGAASWLKNETRECSNVQRSFLNEEFCILSGQRACKVGTQSKETISENVVVCGSPGEVSSEPVLGDFLLDMPAINRGRSREYMVAQDSTGPDELDRQKNFVWNTIVLTAPDQLRQRVAWTLFQIFALPKTAIVGYRVNSEIFLVYYVSMEKCLFHPLTTSVRTFSLAMHLGITTTSFAKSPIVH